MRDSAELQIERSWLQFARGLVGRVRRAVTPWNALLRRPLSVLLLAGGTALLCGLFVAPQGFVLFGAIATIVTMGCLWPWIGIRGVDCQIRFVTARTEEGKSADMVITITNRWPWPVWGLAIEGGFHETEKPEIAVAKIKGWSRTELRWPFVPQVRGRYPVAQPKLVTEFPFGLWKAERPVEVLSKLTVWPRRFRLPPLLLPCGKQSWSGQPLDRTSGRFGQRTSVREYCLGDSMRQIHWAKTALYDKLVSYDREGYAITEATVSLDTHPELHCGSGPGASVEWALRIAASICDVLLKQRIRVCIIAHAGHFRSQGSGDNPVALLDWLATLGTENTKRSEEAERARSRFQHDSLSIHITTDHSASISGDSIVLQLDGHAKPLVPPAARGWMTIASDGDVASQLRMGWQRSPGRRRRVY